MSWPIPAKQNIDSIPSNKVGRVSFLFIFILILIIISCSSWYYISHDSNSFFYAFALCSVSVIIFLLLMGWYFFHIGIKLEKNEIIKSENAGLDEVYSEWASEYISIVAYSYIFPDEAQIESLKRKEEFNVIGQRVLTFHPSIDYAILFYEIISPLRHKLMNLLKDDELEFVFSMGKAIDQSVWKYFTLAWRKLDLPENAIKSPIWMANDYVKQIDAWLDNPAKCFRLIINFQPLASVLENDKAEASDGVCAWLCAPSIKHKDYQIKEKARIYRPMATNASMLVKDVTDVMVYQSKTGNIENLWFSKYKSHETINKITRVSEEFSKEGRPEQFFSDFIIGKQGGGDIWSTIMLSLISSYAKDSVNLIISESDSSVCLSRVKVQRQYDA